MTDPTPLIDHPPSSDSNETSTLDETIERCIGDFGWKQFVQVFLISFSWAFDAQQTFITVFTDIEATWHCTNNGRNHDDSTCSDICLLPKDDWSWDLPPYTSTISEWFLLCAGTDLSSLPASCFFAGSLVGGLLVATLADSKLGRKKLLVISSLLMSLAGFLTAFSSSIWVYSVLRFLSGFGRASVGTTALVLATELVGKRWRSEIGMVGFFCFTFGFLSLPLLGYLNRGFSWRLLYLWTCIPTIFYSIFLHLFVCESPRWLYVQGRREEFIRTLRCIGSASAAETTENVSHFFCVAEINKQDIENVVPNENVTITKTNSYSAAFQVLWQEAWAFRRIMAVMAIGFGMGLVYYGMPLGLHSLAFNIYLSVALNALSELPAALVSLILVGNLSRKGSVFGFTLVSGVCSFICACAMVSGRGGGRWKGMLVGVEVVSFFSACTGLNLLLIYTLELFPTCVRNSALSMVRQAAVLGGVFSPVLAAAGRKNGMFSYGVFGVTIAACGLFVGCLPETRGSSICDTLEEEKQKEIRGDSASAPPPKTSSSVSGSKSLTED